jgi:hypothetical protein
VPIRENKAAHRLTRAGGAAGVFLDDATEHFPSFDDSRPDNRIKPVFQK